MSITQSENTLPKFFTVNDIGITKMLFNPPEEIVNAGMKIISDKHVWIFRTDGRGWGLFGEAKTEDYLTIPQLK